MAFGSRADSTDGVGVDTTWPTGREEAQKEEVKRELVILAWRDIMSFSGWEKASEVDCPTLYTVGWLVSDDGVTVKLANTLDYDDFTDEAKDEAKPIPYGITAFPKGCVLSIKPVKECNHIEF